MRQGESFDASADGEGHDTAVADLIGERGGSQVEALDEVAVGEEGGGKLQRLADGRVVPPVCARGTMP